MVRLDPLAVRCNLDREVCVAGQDLVQAALTIGAEVGDDDDGEAGPGWQAAQEAFQGLDPASRGAPTPTMSKGGQSCRSLGRSAACCSVASGGIRALVARRRRVGQIPLEQPQPGPHHLARGAEAAGGDLLLDEAAQLLGERDAQVVLAWHVAPSAPEYVTGAKDYYPGCSRLRHSGSDRRTVTIDCGWPVRPILCIGQHTTVVQRRGRV